jgi:23S rRNA-/tRNA-specific pseudouridylate synthase
MFDKTFYYNVSHMLYANPERNQLVPYLASIYRGYSIDHFKNLCDRKKIQVNGRIVTNPDYLVKENDHIDFTIKILLNSTATAEDIPLDVLYEDKYLVAINKPANMAVHLGPRVLNGTFINSFVRYLALEKAEQILSLPIPDANATSENSHQNDAPINWFQHQEQSHPSILSPPSKASSLPIFLHPKILHRIDKGTTGVLLACKYFKAHKRFQELFLTRKIRKRYLAICVGNPGNRTIDVPVVQELSKKGHNPNFQKMKVALDLPHLHAITHIRTLATEGKISLLEIEIETGR